MQAVRVEIQAARAEAHTNVETLRAEAHTNLEALRAEARANREALRTEARADRETFERHIIRLTEQQGVLSGHVESILNQLATTQGKPRS